jgi:hypothetical protein
VRIKFEVIRAGEGNVQSFQKEKGDQEPLGRQAMVH